MDVTGVFGPFQKHENEFNEAAALKEIYRFIHRYFTEVSAPTPAVAHASSTTSTSCRGAFLLLRLSRSSTFDFLPAADIEWILLPH